MPVPNFSVLACLEVAEKFGGGVVLIGFQVTTVSNLNPSCIELESELGFDNNLNPSCIEVEFGLGFDNIELFFSCRFCTEMDMTRHALYSCEC